MLSNNCYMCTACGVLHVAVVVQHSVPLCHMQFMLACLANVSNIEHVHLQEPCCQALFWGDQQG